MEPVRIRSRMPWFANYVLTDIGFRQHLKYCSGCVLVSFPCVFFCILPLMQLLENNTVFPTFNTMKLIPILLLPVFAAVLFAPLLSFHKIPVKMICSEQEYCCLAEEEPGCSAEDMECCPPICNPAQCMFCCFVCPVDNKKLTIDFFQVGQVLNRSAGQFCLSEYHSDRFQPPELS
jgi:hypothetical protein